MSNLTLIKYSKLKIIGQVNVFLWIASRNESNICIITHGCFYEALEEFKVSSP